jgi:phosphoadenosine phosphosulfate reductase
MTQPLYFLHNKASAQFEVKLAATIAALRDSAERFKPLTLACSLGAEDMVLVDLIAREKLDVSVFVLQTGRLHAETLGLLKTAQTKYGQLNWRVFEPSARYAEAFTANYGPLAMRDSVALRQACCSLRKMQPLALALKDQAGWITGLRREQSNARADVPLLETETTPEGSRAKLNALVDWTWGDVWHYIQANDVAYNALHDRFYPSIGCEPCTRSVTLGEDFRSGRWWWEASSKECGLHVKHEEIAA